MFSVHYFSFNTLSQTTAIISIQFLCCRLQSHISYHTFSYVNEYLGLRHFYLVSGTEMQCEFLFNCVS